MIPLPESVRYKFPALSMVTSLGWFSCALMAGPPAPLEDDFAVEDRGSGHPALPVAMSKRNNQPEVEAKVGIFWLFEDTLIIDSTPASKAEPYGDTSGTPQCTSTTVLPEELKIRL